jgi:hypothetical protein
MLALLPLGALLLMTTGCTSSLSNSAIQSSATAGPAFLIGTDAPKSSVTSFQVTLDSVELTTASGATASLISGTPTVDFARFNGMQTLVDMNDVQEGTYTGVTITLGSATIGYLNTGATPPSISTMPATLTTSTVSFTFTNPLVVKHDGAPVGLRMDFDLAKSIATDSTGAITGSVTPNFDISTVARTDTGAHIDELIGAVVTVPSSATEPSSFVIQGPHGEKFTVDTTSSTEWDGDASLANLTTSCIVAVAGSLDPADQTLDADEVAILTDTGFYASGLITYVTPTSGAASDLDFYVRSVLPDNTGVQLGNIAQVALTGNEKYYIYWMRNPFTAFLFNSSALTPGQEIGVGGKASGAASESDVTVSRIHLRNWGYNGTIVAGSQNSGNGTFKMQITGFAGSVVTQNVTVYLGANSDFRYGYDAFGGLSDGAAVRVVGVLLKNPSDGSLVLMARHIDGLDFTNFNTYAF